MVSYSQPTESWCNLSKWGLRLISESYARDSCHNAGEWRPYCCSFRSSCHFNSVAGSIWHNVFLACLRQALAAQHRENLQYFVNVTCLECLRVKDVKWHCILLPKWHCILPMKLINGIIVQLWSRRLFASTPQFLTLWRMESCTSQSHSSVPHSMVDGLVLRRVTPQFLTLWRMDLYFAESTEFWEWFLFLTVLSSQCSLSGFSCSSPTSEASRPAMEISIRAVETSRNAGSTLFPRLFTGQGEQNVVYCFHMSMQLTLYGRGGLTYPAEEH